MLSRFILVGIFLCSGLLLAQNGADIIVGNWLNEEKDGKIEIYKKGDKFFGKLIWLKDPENEDGTPRLDKNNPDDDLQSRPLQNLEILSNFVYDNDGEWEDGKIYDPNNGKTYSCYMKFESENVLKIKGYIGVKWIGRTTFWNRAD